MERNLKSKGQHFNQYKQNEQLPLISNHRTQKKTMAHADGNPGIGLIFGV